MTEREILIRLLRAFESYFARIGSPTSLAILEIRIACEQAAMDLADLPAESAQSA